MHRYDIETGTDEALDDSGRQPAETNVARALGALAPVVQRLKFSDSWIDAFYRARLQGSQGVRQIADCFEVDVVSPGDGQKVPA